MDRLTKRYLGGTKSAWKAGAHRQSAGLSSFKQSTLARAVQLAFALGAGAFVFLPRDAAAQACPPDVSGTVTISGSVTNTGVCNIASPSGFLIIDATPGTLTNASGGTLNNYSRLANLGILSNAGTLNNNSYLRNDTGATLSSIGTISNSGYLRNDAGATLNSDAAGTINNNSGGTLLNVGGLSNSGAINNNS